MYRTPMSYTSIIEVPSDTTIKNLRCIIGSVNEIIGDNNASNEYYYSLFFEHNNVRLVNNSFLYDYNINTDNLKIRLVMYKFCEPNYNICQDPGKDKRFIQINNFRRG